MTVMEQHVTISAGTAFKAGFFGFFGLLCAYILLAMIVLIPVLIFGGAQLLRYL